MGRADDLLAAAIVADGLTGGFDARRQRRLADEPITPDVVEQLVLADHPIPVLDQVTQHLEHLGLDGDHVPGPRQLVVVRIDHDVTKRKHRASPSGHLIRWSAS